MGNWNTYAISGGDLELGDWPARMDPAWLNIGWIITQRCNMGCPYCIGWKRDSEPPTVVDKLGAEGAVAALLKLRQRAGKKLYLTISGGEPTLVKGLPEMCARLADEGVVVELHTNLYTGAFKDWVAAMGPRRAMVGQVMATYHGWRLDGNEKARRIYMDNFKRAVDAGLSCVLKTIVPPGEVGGLPDKLCRLRAELPLGAPIQPWGFINGQPKGKADRSRYPYAYTAAECTVLDHASPCRRASQAAYRAGAGWFKGMACDAGRGFLFMDVSGRLYRCFTHRRNPVGDLAAGTLSVQPGPKACGAGYCSTPFWGLWFGKDPWNYVPGLTREAATFCRFGPFGKAERA